MKILKTFKKILITLLFISFSFSNIYADTIEPFINTVDLQTDERTRESITYTSENGVEKEILLEVHGYNINTEEIDEDVPILLRVDTDTFNILPGESKDIPYEVVLPENIEVGTYHNLLVLDPVNKTEDSIITTLHSLSQVVRINIYPAGSDSNLIPVTPADISLEVVTKGIPWIKASEIKYTYENTSNYILQPEGDLQVFNRKQNEEPIYLKINEEEKILNPGEKISETLKINTWNIYDLIQERVVLGRFYNGVDGQYQGEQISIESFKDEVVIVGVVIVFLYIILSESSKSKGRKLPKEYDDEHEDEEE